MASLVFCGTILVLLMPTLVTVDCDSHETELMTYVAVVPTGQGLGHPCGTVVTNGTEAGCRFFVDWAIGAEITCEKYSMCVIYLWTGDNMHSETDGQSSQFMQNTRTALRAAVASPTIASAVLNVTSHYVLTCQTSWLFVDFKLSWIFQICDQNTNVQHVFNPTQEARHSVPFSQKTRN